MQAAPQLANHKKVFSNLDAFDVVSETDSSSDSDSDYDLVLLLSPIMLLLLCFFVFSWVSHASILAADCAAGGDDARGLSARYPALKNELLSARSPK